MSGKKKHVWRCCDRLLNGKQACLKSATVNDVDVKNEIVKAVNKMIREKKEYTESLITKIDRITSKYTEEYHEEVIQAIKSLEQKYKDELAGSLLEISGDFEKSKLLKSNLDKITEEIDKYKTELNMILDQKAISKSDASYYNQLKEELEGERHLITEYAEELVNKLIEKITIHSDKKICIEFKNGFSYETQL